MKMIRESRMHVLFAAVCGLLLTAGAALAADYTKDTLDDVKTNVKAGKAVIVDVREQKEWDKAHLDGALLAPLSALKKGTDPKSLNAKIDKQKILYTHCRAGRRALAAAEILQKLGYEVRPLKQGTAELLEAGFPKAQ